MKHLPNEQIQITKHVSVRSFPGATISSMRCYIQPMLEDQPDKILLYVGTNDHSSTKNANKIVSEIVQKIKYQYYCFWNCLSWRWPNVKGKAVNKCKSNNIWFLDNTNIIPGTHLNRSKLHSNPKGTAL